jgi:Domain of unknown function (DUF4920)
MHCNRIVTTLAVGLTLLLVGGCASSERGDGSLKNGWTKFGSGMGVTGARTVSAVEVLGNVEKYDGKALRVTGKISEVCASKGCWIRLAGPVGGETLFIKFTCPVGGRLVPMEAVGRDAIVQGTLHVTQITEAEAKHYKKDAGAGAAELAKIVGPQKMITMKAPAAMINLSSGMGT